VRNIGYETDQAKFLEFMSKFGPVQYAVLCKAPSIQKDDDENIPIANEGKTLHKGTGFVRFKTQEATDQLLNLSNKVENYLDEERKNARLNRSTQENVVSSLTLLQNEIELNGRRLIVKSSVTKDEAGVMKEQRKAEDRRKKEEADKRNLGMSKEGLLNETNWINQDPVPSQTIMQLRERLYVAKEKALKASTNLFISKTRIQIRHLPRRDFFEKELKELMRVVAEEWSKTLSKEDFTKLYKSKKVLNHVKIMRDEQKKDAAGESLASGQAFVEFANPELALYAVRYLNNVEIVTGKGLIVDYSMED